MLIKFPIEMIVAELFSKKPLPVGLTVVEWDTEGWGSARYRFWHLRSAGYKANIAMFPLISDWFSQGNMKLNP